MPENDTSTVDTQEPAEKTFTQAELDAIVGERLKRERLKYADYSELAEKAKRYDEDQEASKSELQKAIEDRDKLKSQLDTLKAEKERAEQVRELSAKHGVDADLLSRMSGDVEENAVFLASKKTAAPHVPDGGESASASMSSGEQFAEFFKQTIG